MLQHQRREMLQVLGTGMGIPQDRFEMVAALIHGAGKQQPFRQKSFAQPPTPDVARRGIETCRGKSEQMEGAAAKHQSLINAQQLLQPTPPRQRPH